MRAANKVFHLAIPCKDIDETVEFYETLGCRLARRYNDRVTFDFFGDQLVCHLSPENIEKSPQMYPRHFGITFCSRSDFKCLLALAKQNRLPIFQDEYVRFPGKQEEHSTFFLVDPSNNLLEFKYYDDVNMVY